MAYNNYFPQTYQQYGYNPYQQAFSQQTYPQNYQQSQQSQTGQIQNSGFVSVRNIEEAYNWPVAPGNSITFKDENSPYIYTKTKGFSQLEPPIFERFRLVKEEETQNTHSDAQKGTENAFNAEEQIKLLWDEIDALKTQYEAVKPKAVKKPVKKETDNEPDAE